ncbi:hypothetical protein SDC9_197433 [bioreactor metagenome]|uniref:Uncharacterized protein n=1 Tax=bioreactor metagenome TaxID=1076179 RepID=A0A645IER5_9ZZZZ
MALCVRIAGFKHFRQMPVDFRMPIGYKQRSSFGYKAEGIHNITGAALGFKHFLDRPGGCIMPFSRVAS